jgi:hypothetical protein
MSYSPFQVFDTASFHDSESEEVLEEPLDALDPSCYNKGNDVIENIDDFIHVGRCKWDVICYGLNGDPIYDIEGHFQLLPLEKPCVIATDSDMFGNMKMTWLHIYSDHPGMTYCSILMMIHGHILEGLIHTLLRTWIYSTKKISTTIVL